ncbi:MAG TPA: FtsX-like permease family protein [Thermoanaerobaculia bacterium]|nr:FtsX-like permease family protein [Thermoanaerobaculia bacterium]
MSYELRIAIRYLWAARRRLHTAFLALISTLGLAVGVATLLISLALLSGLQGKIKGRLVASSPHLLLEPVQGDALRDGEKISAALRKFPVLSSERVISGMAWAANPSEGAGRPIRIRSYSGTVAPAAERSFGREWAIPSRDPRHEIFITRDLASTMSVFLGDDITVVAPRTRLTPFGPVPVWKKYRIARLLPAAQDEHAAEAFLSFEEESALFQTGGFPTSVEVYLRDVSVVDEIQATLQSELPSVRVKSWKDINKPLFLALRLEKVVMFATISLIIFVAALNLISSLSMLIVEKRSRVGILRTLGASESSILMIFLGVGLLIGLFGTLLGNLLGIGLSWAADRYHLVPLPGDMYFVTYIPFTIDWRDVLGVNLIAIALSSLATWYPARMASKLDPIVAIREE